jgi:Protein of unknown function (DUF2783)
MPLVVKSNLADPDGFYQELIDSQRDMGEAEAAMMNARLVLLLANHIGDRASIREAILLAGGKA